MIHGFAIEADALVPCACGAREGQPCRPTFKRDRARPWPPGQVHFGRRVRRLLLTAKAPMHERESLEREAMAMLKEDLEKRKRRRKTP